MVLSCHSKYCYKIKKNVYRLISRLERIRVNIEIRGVKNLQKTLNNSYYM